MNLPLLDSEHPEFPNPQSAAEEPDGLLAVGGNLSPEVLLDAYRHAIFPWYQAGEPILWWSPSTRCVLLPTQLHLSKSLRKYLRQHSFTLSTDRAFDAVMRACARPRDQGTWITPAMMQAYLQLHRLGYAHSIEVWNNNRLVGGLYGVAVGAVFCGESMFSHITNGSKIALACLCHWLDSKGFAWLDCQLTSSHLLSMGAETISREEFLTILRENASPDIAWPIENQINWSVS